MFDDTFPNTAQKICDCDHASFHLPFHSVIYTLAYYPRGEFVHKRSNHDNEVTKLSVIYHFFFLRKGKRTADKENSQFHTYYIYIYICIGTSMTM